MSYCAQKTHKKYLQVYMIMIKYKLTFGKYIAKVINFDNVCEKTTNCKKGDRNY